MEYTVNTAKINKSFINKLPLSLVPYQKTILLQNLAD